MDDPVDAMNERTHPRRRSRAELDAIVDGFDDGSQLARLVAALRNAESVEPATASPELVEFVSSPRSPNGAEPSTSGTRSSMSGASYSSLPSRLMTARVLLVAGTAVVASVGLFASGVLGRAPQEVEVSVAGDPGSASGSPGAAGDTTPTTVSQGAKYIEAGDAGHLMVGVWEGALVLDALVPADDWEATVVEEAPALIQVSFQLGEGMVDVTIEPEGDSRWLVRIHDSGTGTEEEAYLDEYSSPGTPVDDVDPGPSTSVGPSTSIVSPSTSAPPVPGPSTSVPPVPGPSTSVGPSTSIVSPSTSAPPVPGPSTSVPSDPGLSTSVGPSTSIVSPSTTASDR